MTMKPEARFDDCCRAFAESYEISNLPAMREVECSVLGCDYGGTSWTTSTQAAQIVELLNLHPGVELLEVGAGSGWPGLYLADTSGCDVTLVDLPINALTMARQRARTDGIADRVRQIAASGSALPFTNGCFAAISHSDVLCCIPQKSEMLRECRRVAAYRAKMHFSVIAIPRVLSGFARRRAVEAGPPFVDAPGSYSELLPDAGWRLIRQIDVTSEFRRSLCTLVHAFEDSARLSDALGRDVVTGERERRKEQIAAINAGLLVRAIYLAAAA